MNRLWNRWHGKIWIKCSTIPFPFGKEPELETKLPFRWLLYCWYATYYRRYDNVWTELEVVDLRRPLTEGQRDARAVLACIAAGLSYLSLCWGLGWLVALKFAPKEEWYQFSAVAGLVIGFPVLPAVTGLGALLYHAFIAPFLGGGKDE